MRFKDASPDRVANATFGPKLPPVTILSSKKVRLQNPLSFNCTAKTPQKHIFTTKETKSETFETSEISEIYEEQGEEETNVMTKA